MPKMSTLTIDCQISRHHQSLRQVGCLLPGDLSSGLLRASCLNNSFINTPHWNLTFFLINCTSALSPSGLTAVTPLRSIMSSRPSRLSMASLHAVMNSATQGEMSLPSTISRHRRGPSTSEIFNMHTSSCPRDSARTGPNVQAGRVEIGLQELVCVHAALTGSEPQIRRTPDGRCQTFSSGPTESCDSWPGERQLREGRPRAPSIR